jgi:2-polyprenyl-6-methoxyphenol hydroxylase-like FAD-dependent oxidoreductase
MMDAAIGRRSDSASLSCEVLVVGGGPAGCATAIALQRRGRSCVLLERSRYERPRVGESLPPPARRLLRDLGVWERFLADRHVPSPGNLSVWGSATPGETDFITDPNGCGWHVDRCRFDQMLYETVAEPGRAERGVTALDCRRTGTGWRVLASDGRWTRQYDARFLVDATGRRRSLSRLTTLSVDVRDGLFSIVGIHQLPLRADADTRTWVEAVEDGWWYSAPVPQHRMIVAFMTDADVLKRDGAPLSQVYERRLRQTELSNNRLAGADRSLDIIGLSAASCVARRVAGADFLAVGDAAAAVDPLSSDGLCNALEDGTRAGYAIDAHFSGDLDALRAYEQYVRQRFSEFSGQQRWIYGLERRWPSSRFWQRRQPAA